MKRLTQDEITFIRGSNYTATVWQCDEWERTIWGHEPSYDEVIDFCGRCNIANVYDTTSAIEFLDHLHAKFNTIEDGISLEMLAIYLFRTFLLPDQLIGLLDAPSHDGMRPSAKWLQDWKYNFGFRKWQDADYLVRDALDTHVELDTTTDEIWYINNDATTN